MASKRKPNPLASAKAKLALEAEHTRRQAFLALLRERGLPEPETEIEYHPSRKYRGDFVWREYAIVLNSHGGIWNRGKHGRPLGIIGDMEQSAEAQIAGWMLLAVESGKLATDDTCNLIKRALFARANDGA